MIVTTEVMMMATWIVVWIMMTIIVTILTVAIVIVMMIFSTSNMISRTNKYIYV